MYIMDLGSGPEPLAGADTSTVADTLPRKAPGEVTPPGQCHKAETARHTVLPHVVPSSERECSRLRPRYVCSSSSRLPQSVCRAGSEQRQRFSRYQRSESRHTGGGSADIAVVQWREAARTPEQVLPGKPVGEHGAHGRQIGMAGQGLLPPQVFQFLVGEVQGLLSA